jgi:hypothetical protein
MHGVSLHHAVTLCPWPTPNVPNRGVELSKDHRPNSGGIDPQSTAALAGWGTPQATDGTHGGPNQDDPAALPRQAAISGATPSTSPVATAKRGALASDLARWLMGFPPEWTVAGRRAWGKSRAGRRQRRKNQADQ